MNRRASFFLATLFIFGVLWPVHSAAPAPVAPKRPKLILLLIMDQFRQDFLERHRASFVPGGFRLLMDRGAVFENCNYLYSTTLTAPGHTVISTGSYPMNSGIIANGWYDRDSGRATTADRDDSVKLLGAQKDSPGSSPHWLVGSAFADELRLASAGRSRAIAISGKARSAVLPGGRGANAAYWIEANTLHAVSSTYYMKDLPEWVKEFNTRDRVAEFAGTQWKPVDNPKGEAFRTFGQITSTVSRRTAGQVGQAVYDSPFVTGIEFALARAAVEHEKLGSGTASDFLSISVSATDFVGHEYGPDSAETRDTILRADRDIAEFLRFLDARIGLANVWVAFSADHGVVPRAEVARDYGLNAGRVADQQVLDKIESALGKAYSPAASGEKWVSFYEFPNVYLNHKLIAARNLDEAEAARRAARALLELPGFAAAFTAADLAGCQPSPELAGKVCRSFYPPRAGDIYLVFKPYWIYELKSAPTGTGHGSPYPYDTHVPLILMGGAFRPGAYYSAASPADIAVTLAAALGINAPVLSTGRALGEALAPAGTGRKAQ